MVPAAVTLVFLFRPLPSGAPEVLLGLKKTGFGTGKVVGIGGHLEAGETAAAAAVRELFEETSVRLTENQLAYRGSVAFRFPERPEWDMDTDVFSASDWQGEPRETSEINPEWHALDRLPLHRMWQDAGYWLPVLLNGPEQHFTVRMAADNEAVAEVLTAPARP
ncbi:8-oxo-dGTP diphosphatase [Arthrobacter russicus]|jgi:8-oxo-dGTP diphosphatase|uniref:Oxidized purine nucleoside triphosphate hydrolase n=1 Tax=Arthrobacter russicus TaxID=172040 RepID=A0ABU1JHM5_9MICC|nr:8-oxo-dGTP diphosphatase [Arthrobacter russicus]MDR6270876.1 8-oxo-dGTP diphosphatase [Arthrobacter russicus]